MIQLGIWAVIQSWASIVCCCAPVYNTLPPSNGFWGRLTSKFNRYRLRGSRSGGNDRPGKSYSIGDLKIDSLELDEETRVSDAESWTPSQRCLQVGAT